ncbi:MAG TPA: hypothetical protein VEK39_00985 [Solirubrobacterales bacterium]|nr:hypothetical protein [Solirubrobacterales bacterium]
MALFEVDQAKQEEWKRKYREAVASKLDGSDVLAVGPFQRTGQYFLTIPLIGQLMGLILYLVHAVFQKRRSGGLPSNYLLVVTADKVHAFKYRGSYGGVKVKDEVAVWNRSDLRLVDRQDGALATTLTFEATEDGERASFKANTPKLSSNPWSAEVVELIEGGGSPA